MLIVFNRIKLHGFYVDSFQVCLDFGNSESKQTLKEVSGIQAANPLPIATSISWNRLQNTYC
jgi:hypothetical protein